MLLGKKLKLMYIDFSLPYLLKGADYPVGGAAVEWYAWIKGLEANNCKVGVLTWKGAKEYLGNTSSVKLIEGYNPKVGIRKLRWFYHRYPRLLRAIKDSRPDVIMQECAGTTTGIFAHIGKKLKIPFVYRVANDIETDDRYKERLSNHERILFRYGLKRSNGIFCQNTYQFKNLKEKYPDKKLFIIHNPFYHDGKLPDIVKRDGRSYVAWIGVFQHQKNLPVLYSIAKELENIEFRIAGRARSSELDGETLDALKNLRKCNNVKFVGYLNRKEIPDFLSRAFVSLNTSHYEGFSNTILESLAAGTPMVTTKHNDPDNIIFINKLGAVAEGFSGLKHALNRSIYSAEYDILTKRCRRYLLEHHDTKILSKQFVHNLLEIM